MSCCSCGGTRLDAIVDLGSQPDPDFLLDPSDSGVAPEAPVRLAICVTCGLVQLLGPRPDGPRPAHGHAMAASNEDPWVGLIKRALPAAVDVAVDVDGSSGLPVESFCSPDHVVAGLSDSAASGAKLILVGHALAHADDIDSIVGRIETALAPTGLVAIDFHHVLGLVQGQFDVVAHTHRSYLSLLSLERALGRHGLGVVAATRTPDYGGTVRVLAARASAAHAESAAAEQIRDAERRALVDRRAGYAGLEQRMRTTCAQLVAHLDVAREAGRTVVGYGAASRGTTLLNLAGVGVDALSCIVDRAPAKQGRLLPRARIPILAPSELERVKPSEIVILPWPSAGQISGQLAHARDWGARFFVAVPALEVVQ
jgi:hypothetical protein